jgi:KDO2-lipid IV(A) lauroyltransferase
MAGRRTAPWRSFFARAADAIVSPMVKGGLHLLRLFPRKGTADFCAAVLRTIGPWIPEHRIGRANLIAAFPEKSSREIEAILRGVWDNLGRFGADFAHLDRITLPDLANPKPADIEYSPQAEALFKRLLDQKQPALVFAAHLGNWELPAVVAHRYGLDTVALYRRPGLGGAADAAIDIRSGAMGDLVAAGLDAPIKLAKALEDKRLVAMLVDQYAHRGVDVTFFGQVTTANPLTARLLAHVECPLYGTRIIRLPDNRFRADLTGPIEPARDGAGNIDIAGTMQIITSVIEGWIREYPEQWLWLHRRWRSGKKRWQRRARGRLDPLR